MTNKKTPLKRPASKKVEPTNKASKKTAAKSHSSSMAQRATSPWWRRLWGVAWKCALALLAVLLFAGLYLDSVVKQRFEGQLFDLPTVMYARVLTLQPGDSITLAEVRNELDILNYRKVSQPRLAGEYSSSATRIELIRRPFEFADGPEADRHVMLTFDQNGLQQIQSLEARQGQLGFFSFRSENARHVRT